MPTPVIARWRAALNISLLTDASRGTLLASILEVAPKSALMSNTAVGAAYADLTAKGAALATRIAGAAAAQQQARLSVDLLATSRSAYDLSLLALAGLVEANAASAEDLTGMGFPLFSLTKPSRTRPDPPVGALLVTTGRSHGKARVTVPRVGNGTRFVAEVSSDPVGIWSSLPGNGRQRKLSGATGTRLWVRFATVRFGMQSDWSTPVLVTLP
jgi:hypothetical protein